LPTHSKTGVAGVDLVDHRQVTMPLAPGKFVHTDGRDAK